MTREGFNQKLTAKGFTIEGDIARLDGHVRHILACSCGEPECEGWATVPEDSVGEHEWREGRMSYEDAMDRDAAVVERILAGGAA